jgi:hypothetical protein
MQKALTLAALAIAVKAQASVVSDDSEYCAKYVSADSDIVFTAITGDDLTVGSTTWMYGWTAEVAVPSGETAGYCDHWNDVSDSYLSLDVSSGGTGSVGSNNDSEYWYVEYATTCDEPDPDTDASTGSATDGDYTIVTEDIADGDTCGTFFRFEWTSTDDMLEVSYYSDNAVLGAVSAFAVVAFASLF